MPSFSQRYGYMPLEKAIIRECMPKTIENSLCTAFDRLRRNLMGGYMGMSDKYKDLEQYLWLYFLNQRLNDFSDGTYYEPVATEIIQDVELPWFKKLDMIEEVLKYLRDQSKSDQIYTDALQEFQRYINGEFERHNYSYRIVDNSIGEITSREEKEAIEAAITESKDNIKLHLTNALEAYAKKPVGDYSNSIKESITAVEAICREKTGKDTLGRAIDELEKKGFEIPKVMRIGLEKLYAYTNDKSTGIRHALMDEGGTYIPGPEEARYMLIVCSAFINYIRDKCK